MVNGRLQGFRGRVENKYKLRVGLEFQPSAVLRRHGVRRISPQSLHETTNETQAQRDQPTVCVFRLATLPPNGR